jgi:mono/diheme cytochrome c family protein
MPRMPRLIAVTLVLLLGGVACNREVAGGKADGAAVFAEVCSRCHGPGGTPPASLATQLGVRDLRSPEFAARATLDSIKQQIAKGSSNAIMPPFAGTLSDAQIDAVAAYVLALSTVPAE